MKISLLVLGLFTGFLIALLLSIISTCNNASKYYDGEGNGIPEHAVKILVRSQFVHVAESEQDTLNKYFYIIN